MPVQTPGIRGQTQLDDLIPFDGTIASGGTAQLLVPQQPRRLFLEFWNTSDTVMSLGIGPAQATPTVTNGGVASVAVTNGGVGYTVAPQVVFLGGVVAGDYKTAPQHPAAAHAVLSGSAVNSIVVDDPGAGYLTAPLVYLMNPLPKLGGGAYVTTATTGIIVPPVSATLLSGWSTRGMLLVPSSAISVFCATSSKTFVCKVGGID